jgi:hypothetical protein
MSRAEDATSSAFSNPEWANLSREVVVDIVPLGILFGLIVLGVATLVGSIRRGSFAPYLVLALATFSIISPILWSVNHFFPSFLMAFLILGANLLFRWRRRSAK